MSEGWISTAIELAGGTVITGLGYIANRHNKRMERLEQSRIEDHDALANFKLEAAQTYAREAALKRIYDLIDEQGRDIKQILQKI